MDHIEMVENLRQKADISYSEAKEALERADWDMLEAMILLENEGKVEKNTTESSSEEKEGKYNVVAATASLKNDHARRTVNNLKELAAKIFRTVCGNYLMVKRKGELIVKMPLILLAVLCLARFDVMVCALIAGLFIGCSYKVEGTDFNSDSKVNQVMDDVNNSFDHMMNDEK